jgi:uncharacterized membrane protein HdeD (DUF308 family)
MTFYGTCVFLLNLLARLFGVVALLAGGSSLIGAYAIEADRWVYFVFGLLLIAMGVAVFMAKPVTVETIASMRRRMGRPD